MFGVVVMALLVAGNLDSQLAVLALMVVAPVTGWYVFKQLQASEDAPSKSDSYIALAVLLGILGWSVFNARFSAQNIYIYRDPAIYSNNGAWLVDNEDIEIHASDVFGDAERIKGNGASLGHLRDQDDERLYVHGGQLLPAFLGLFGRIAGEEGSFVLNSYIGGLALLTFFGLSRFYVRTKWAAFATLSLATLLPMIYFSRDNYTEPLSLLFVFSALSLTHLAFSSKKLLLWVMAGASVGAITLTRIDAYLVVAGFLLAFAIWSALALTTKQKLAQAKNLLGYLVGMGAVSLFGWFAYTEIGAKYYHDLRDGFMQQIVLIGALGGSMVIAWLISTNKRLLKFLDAKTKAWRWPLLAVVVIAGIAYITSRPLWMTGYWSRPNSLVSLLLQAEGDPVEPRSFSEHSFSWVWWYTGPFLALAGVIGYLKLARDVLSKKKLLHYVILLSVFTLPFLIYVLRTSITPDQVWASRRYLPIVFPGLVLFAAVGFQALSDRFIRKCHLLVLSWPLAITLAAPLFISQPFLFTKTFEHEYAHVQQVCTRLSDDAAVLMLGSNGYNMLQAIRTYCDVPVERSPERSTEELAVAAQAARQNGYEPYVFIHGNDLKILPEENSKLTLVSEGAFTDLQRKLYHPPRRVDVNIRQVYLGKITDTGRIVAL